MNIKITTWETRPGKTIESSSTALFQDLDQAVQFVTSEKQRSEVNAVEQVHVTDHEGTRSVERFIDVRAQFKGQEYWQRGVDPIVRLPVPTYWVIPQYDWKAVWNEIKTASVLPAV